MVICRQAGRGGGEMGDINDNSPSFSFSPAQPCEGGGMPPLPPSLSTYICISPVWAVI